MKPSELRLYGYLMERSEFYCSREFQMKDCDLQGVSPRAACNARKKLQEYGLIQYKAGLGNRYTYTICDPKTKQPYPGDPKIAIVMPKRSRSNAEETLIASPRQTTKSSSPTAVLWCAAEIRLARVATFAELDWMESQGQIGKFCCSHCKLCYSDRQVLPSHSW